MARIVSGQTLLQYFSEVLGEDQATVKRITISMAYDDVIEITVEKLGTDEIESRFLNYEHLDKAVEILRARKP